MGVQEVDRAFPEPLKGPILRRIQCRIIPRIDVLVDRIYDEFKSDYYPGETVTIIRKKDGERVTDGARLSNMYLMV